MYLSIPSPLDPLTATDQFEDTQIEVNLDKKNSYYTILVTSGGSSSNIQCVVDVPRTTRRSLFRTNRIAKERSELIRPLSPINSNRSCALDEPIYRKRSDSHSCPPPQHRRRRQDDGASVTTNSTASTVSRQQLYSNQYHNNDANRSSMRRETSCPPALRQLLSADTEVISNGRNNSSNSSSSSGASSVILQEPDFPPSHRSKKPNFVSATASRQGLILRTMRGAGRKIMPSPSNSSTACVF